MAWLLICVKPLSSGNNTDLLSIGTCHLRNKLQWNSNTFLFRSQCVFRWIRIWWIPQDLIDHRFWLGSWQSPWEGGISLILTSTGTGKSIWQQCITHHSTSHRSGSMLDQVTGLVVNYGISNTYVLEIPKFTTKPARYICSRTRNLALNQICDTTWHMMSLGHYLLVVEHFVLLKFTMCKRTSFFSSDKEIMGYLTKAWASAASKFINK